MASAVVGAGMRGSRELREVAANDPLTLREQLRAALAGRGPALLPRAAADTDVPPPAALPAVPERAALVIETSGSVARPKRVVLSGDGLIAAAHATHDRLAALAGTTPGGEEWLLCLPAHYIAGAQVLVRSLAADRIPAVLTGSFTAAAFCASAADLTGRLRYASLVPVQLRRLLDAAEHDPAVAAAVARFDALLVGGQATPPELRERAARHGWRVVTSYGSSETSGGAAYNAMPLPGVTVREHGGELLVASPSLALGYLDDPERTAAAFIEREGMRWYRTGDAGSVDADGRIRVTGRLDSVIISGGVKVNLDEIAAAATAAAGEPVVAVSVPSAQWGERVALVAAAPGNAEPTAGATDAWAPVLTALDRFGPAARPALLLRIPALPLLASGKPDRRALRTLAAEHAGGEALP